MPAAERRALLYTLRRAAAILLVILLVTWITPPLDSVAADGGPYRGGGRSTAGATTGQATERSSSMQPPAQYGQVEEDGMYPSHQLKTYGTGDLGIEVRWFHPQTGELIYAATYDAKTGDLLGGHE